jgi:uncharacterized membrane protein
MTDASLKRRRLWHDTRGFAAVLLALTLSALIGFTALGVETGLWYVIKRQNQSAADVAALSGALELLAGKSNGLTQNAIYPDICNLAQRDAARNNFTFNSFSCPATTPACTNPATGQMCANNPPVLGGLGVVGNTNAVEVILAQQQNTFFANLFLPTVTIDPRFSSHKVLNNPISPDHVLHRRPWTRQSARLSCTNPGGVLPGTCSIAANSTSVGTPQ